MILIFVLSLAFGFTEPTCEDRIKNISSPLIASLAVELADGRVSPTEIRDVSRHLNLLSKSDRVSIKSFNLGGTHDILHLGPVESLKQDVAFYPNSGTEFDLDILRDENGFEVSYQNKTYRFVYTKNGCALDSIKRLDNKILTILKDGTICNDLALYFNSSQTNKLDRLKILIRERLSMLKKPGQIAFFSTPNSDQMTKDELSEFYKKEWLKCQSKTDFVDFKNSAEPKLDDVKKSFVPSSTP